VNLRTGVEDVETIHDPTGTGTRPVRSQPKYGLLYPGCTQYLGEEYNL
jgi:hypothetical protein